MPTITIPSAPAGTRIRLVVEGIVQTEDQANAIGDENPSTALVVAGYATMTDPVLILVAQDVAVEVLP